MKKNKMMRLASAMMVMTLMTTSVISGTFAKYVTSDEASDTARVAKWGITVMASGNLFGTDYDANNGTEKPDSIVATSTNVSAAQNTDGTRDNVVAPGTKNAEGFSLTISGTPEVAYDVTATDNSVEAKDIFLAAGTYGVMVEATGLNAALTDMTGYYTSADDGVTFTAATGKWESGKKYYELHDSATLSETYYPINWAVVNTGSAAAIATTKNLATIGSTMVTNLEALAGNANVSSSAKYTLTWEWPFHVDDKSDAADTILGNLMVSTTNGGALLDGSKVVKLSGSDYTSTFETGDYSLDVAFGLKVTVTQVN